MLLPQMMLAMPAIFDAAMPPERCHADATLFSPPPLLSPVILSPCHAMLIAPYAMSADARWRYAR